MPKYCKKLLLGVVSLILLFSIVSFACSASDKNASQDIEKSFFNIVDLVNANDFYGIAERYFSNAVKEKKQIVETYSFDKQELEKRLNDHKAQWVDIVKTSGGIDMIDAILGKKNRNAKKTVLEKKTIYYEGHSDRPMKKRMVLKLEYTEPDAPFTLVNLGVASFANSWQVVEKNLGSFLSMHRSKVHQVKELIIFIEQPYDLKEPTVPNISVYKILGFDGFTFTGGVR